MVSLSPTVRIWLAAQPVDLRKSFDSLAALVRDGLQGDPLWETSSSSATGPPIASSS
ncbi:IS66 family insertion sequence element accessory protein TnpB [Singulisphaera sp. Ch08]|uniref:IS66 family insertion sequence element accessory protein TnpB n=1 Tax=Singulisphaera sp. Ch08 TaxID=3120278 RepID=A0AAU7CK41_9BACT